MLHALARRALPSALALAEPSPGLPPGQIERHHAESQSITRAIHAVAHFHTPPRAWCLSIHLFYLRREGAAAVTPFWKAWARTRGRARAQGSEARSRQIHTFTITGENTNLNTLIAIYRHQARGRRDTQRNQQHHPPLLVKRDHTTTDQHTVLK